MSLSTQTRRNYVDGLRLNYNNGMFGLHLVSMIWLLVKRRSSTLMTPDDGIAIDLAASVMFFPGLEARLGYAHESLDERLYGRQ